MHSFTPSSKVKASMKGGKVKNASVQKVFEYQAREVGCFVQCSPCASGVRGTGIKASQRTYLSRLACIPHMMAVLVVLLGVCAVSSPGSAAEPRAGKLRFVPELPATGDSLKVKTSLTGSASRAEIRWYLNGDEVQQSDIDSFSTTAEFHHPIKAGDQIKVEVTPYDDYGKAGAVSSRSIVCQNAPPLLRLVRQDLDGEAYVAQVEAEDPEGRDVSFTLRQGPQGMKIDKSGHIRWQMPKDASGGFTVKVAAKDEDGGEAVLSYTFTVRRQR